MNRIISVALTIIICTSGLLVVNGVLVLLGNEPLFSAVHAISGAAGVLMGNTGIWFYGRFVQRRYICPVCQNPLDLMSEHEYRRGGGKHAWHGGV